METYKWNPQIVEMIESRIDKMDVFSDMALAAYLLDPKYRGEKFSDDQKDLAEIFIFNKLSADGIIVIHGVQLYVR